MNWKSATLQKVLHVGGGMKAFTFSTDEWETFEPGQHFDIRLTAPDGYQAQRSYSVVSAPEDKGIYEFGVQILTEGEVSGYLDTADPGEKVELRGPVGRHFIWNTEYTNPVVWIAGGSGLAPFMSMLRHYRNVEADNKVKVIFSTRSEGDILWQDELMQTDKQFENITLDYTLTRNWPENWQGGRGRIDREYLRKCLEGFATRETYFYICGNNSFVESMSGYVVQLGFMPEMVKTERFG